jgi:N-acyl-D-aspartate/D-glutamate deacylase
LTVRADQYPYCAASTRLAPLILKQWVFAGGKEDMLNRLASPLLSQRIHQEITEKLKEMGGPQAIRIAFFREQRRFEGQTLAQISRTMRVSPITAALRILQTGNPQVVVFAMNETDVQHFMNRPYVMTASDGWNLPYGQGIVHPRNYGAFVRKIRRYVLDKNVITMEHAIRSATSLPADMLGLADRGRIKQGFAADIVVFDPKTIRDRATYERPHQYPQGIEYVLVNGVPTIHEGRYTGALAGKPLLLSAARHTLQR